MFRIRSGVGFIAVALAACVCASTPAYAMIDMPKHNPVRKLGRGLANAIGGALEIPVNIAIESAQDGPVAGLSVGLLYGIGAAVTRMGVGIVEVLTFPFPLSPMGYGPFYEPEFVPVQYLNEPPPRP